MAEEETKEQQEQASELMFQDAVDALRRGDKPRAKEILTLLLKEDQKNPTYWIWLSASVDSPKERVYCLQTALKLDPENTTAKRGLVLLGAMPPDEAIGPFPMNRPRVWEEKLLLSNEKPKEKGFKVFARSPVARLLGLLVIAAGLITAVVFGFVLPRQGTQQAPTRTNTPGPSPTFSPTPTIFGATAVPTQFFTGPTPLWMLLPATYTPTPIYVSTPRSPGSKDQFRFAKEAYDKQDWDTFITNMELISKLEPEAPDIPYMIGEAYRFKGVSTKALGAYNDSLQIDPSFAPAYLGLARIRIMAAPGYNAKSLFDSAIKYDPNYGEAYLERARFFISRNEPENALEDLEMAESLLLNSTDVYLAYADAYLAMDDNEKALEAAEKAYSVDITSLPVYKMLGELYLEDGQYQRAVEALEVYTIFEDEDALALARLGQAYYQIGEFESAIGMINTATTINRTGLRRFFLYRGLSYLELGQYDEAVDDLEVAKDVDKDSFDASLGLVRAYYGAEKFGSAFLNVEAMKLVVETDEQNAIRLYWRALIQEQRDETKDAVKTWNQLLDLDKDLLTDEMVNKAEERLKILVPPTATPKVSATPSRTPSPTRTPTATSIP